MTMVASTDTNQAAPGSPQPSRRRRHPFIWGFVAVPSAIVVAAVVTLGIAWHDTQSSSSALSVAGTDLATPDTAATPVQPATNDPGYSTAAGGCSVSAPASSINNGRVVITSWTRELFAGLSGQTGCLPAAIDLSGLMCGGCNASNIPGLPYGAPSGAVKLLCWGLVSLVGNPTDMGPAADAQQHTFDADFSVAGKSYSLQVDLINRPGSNWQAMAPPGFTTPGSASQQLGGNCQP